MNQTYFPHLERLIAAHTGLQLRPREREALYLTLTVRMAALKLQDAHEYQRLLEAGTPDAEREWDQLTGRLTNNESYFFRDKGQMALLRDRILPELIARNRDRRSLRLWSAGCSTGEEAYSLAILVEELLPQRGAASGAPWEIVILGTDLDAQALQTARRGIYSAWSFRTMEAAQQQRWFQRRENGWQVSEESRALVAFRRCNLVVDRFPSTALGIHEMDLILCRNVFIYFAHAAVSAVLPKFASTLREGGYLMTGHAETLNQLLQPLVARQFPESVVYQRVNPRSSGAEALEGVARRPPSRNTAQTVAAGPSPASAQSRRELPNGQLSADGSALFRTGAAPTGLPERALAEAEARYAAGDNEGTIRILQPLQGPVDERTLLLLAHAHANVGHAEEAAACCRSVTDAFPFAAEPYELLAVLAQEQRRYEDAKALLKQALYLAPGSPMPHLELGELYEREGDNMRAHQMRAAALELLKSMPAETVVGFSGGPTALEWRQHLERRLKEGA